RSDPPGIAKAPLQGAAYIVLLGRDLTIPALIRVQAVEHGLKDVVREAREIMQGAGFHQIGTLTLNQAGFMQLADGLQQAVAAGSFVEEGKGLVYERAEQIRNLELFNFNSIRRHAVLLSRLFQLDDGVVGADLFGGFQGPAAGEDREAAEEGFF